MHLSRWVGPPVAKTSAGWSSTFSEVRAQKACGCMRIMLPRSHDPEANARYSRASRRAAGSPPPRSDTPRSARRSKTRARYTIDININPYNKRSILTRFRAFT
jgi:hypothetical protein